MFQEWEVWRRRREREVGAQGPQDSRPKPALTSTHPQDGSGYIDENELDALLKDLYEKNKKVSHRALGLVGMDRDRDCAPLLCS